MIPLPTPPSFRLDGKQALVVGATSGIGLGAAVALAHAGANVVLAARTLDRLQATKNAFLAKDLSCDILQMDITDTANIRQKLAPFGGFDIMVNSAGLARHSTAINTSEVDYNAVMDGNVKGAFFLTTAVAKTLLEAGKPGSLINISSQMGHVGGHDRAVYCASKHAVEGFTKSMAVEWGPHNIRINTICPTFIKTPLTKPILDNAQQRGWIESMIKLPRLGEIEDIMGPVVFLASDAASLITGASLLVDGGWTAD